jgi:hypothetical protein
VTADLKVLPKPQTDNQASIALLEEVLARAKSGEVTWVLLAHGTTGDVWENRRAGLEHAEAMGYLHRFMHKLQQAWDAVS